MKLIKRIIKWIWNLVMTLISIPFYFALILPLAGILLCEVAKMNSVVIKALLDGLKKKKV